MFLGSSAVEQAAVNRLVAGSNPARGAIFLSSMQLLIKGVIAALSSSYPVILPTDTLYSLSVDATSKIAVNELFQLKERASSKAIPVFVNSIEQTLEYFELTNIAHKLAENFWPGALTLILNSKSKLVKNLSTTNKLAVRMPAHKLVLEVIKQFGKPITGTSANISGASNIFDYDILLKTFQGKVPMIIRGNINKTAKPSTIVDCSGSDLKILRIGAIPNEKILRFNNTIKKHCSFLPTHEISRD